MLPKVTVIIPSYNHAKFLPRRIESVLEQSFENIEVLLLDDCSPDNSREVIQHYANLDTRIRVILNEQNSGSTFKQWNKGIALSCGEYIWIAESDDYAHPELLQTLIATLDADSAIGIAYCESYSVDQHDNELGTWQHFLTELDPQLWSDNFVKDGIDLVRRFMSYRNIIPNASAVLVRRSTLLRVGPADESMKILGDWLFWAKILAVSKIAYIARPMNYFRMHLNNVRSKTLINGTALVETTQVLADMRQYGVPDPSFYAKGVDLLLAVWFHAWIYYDIPWERHQVIYRNMVALDNEFSGKFRRALTKFLFGNKMSGMRQFVGDKLGKMLKSKVGKAAA